MRVDGSCHCGAITYEAQVDPERVGICHCADCQALTGSAFRVYVPALADTFVIRGQKPTIYVKTADSGTKRAQAFCPACGSPVYSTSAEAAGVYSLRVGALRQRAELPPKVQIWCSSAVPWSMNLKGVTKLDRQ